jgi:hypothetical protein
MASHRAFDVVFLFADRRDVVQSASCGFDAFQAGDHPPREIGRRETNRRR